MPLFPVPIVLLLFNRPDTTRRVVAQVQALQPAHLYVVADGPRPHVCSDVRHCAEAREVVESVHWLGTVHRLYANKNLGCRQRISSGITAVFEEVEHAIILEDDCLPHPSFFPYCQALLHHFVETETVMSISGDNFQPHQPSTEKSYYFSQYMHCWGWATWKRAWDHFDLEMTRWPALRSSNWLYELLGSRRAAFYWSSIFDQVYNGNIDSWAYIWQYSIWLKSGMNVLPAHNLVSNIGFGEAATHTSRASSPQANLPTRKMAFPLLHPQDIQPDFQADRYTQRFVFDKGWLRTLARHTKALLKP